LGSLGGHDFFDWSDIQLLENLKAVLDDCAASLDI